MSALAILSLCLVSAAAETPEADVARMQGAWQMTAMQNGVAFRIVKVVADQTTTVSVYRGDELVQQHKSEFELQFTGDVRIFHYKNSVMTAGPDKSKPRPGGRYIYRLEDDKWIGVFGLLEGETRPLFVEQFERVLPP